MHTNDRTHHLQRSHEASRLGVAALLCLGTLALAPAASADPGNGQANGRSTAVGSNPS